LHAKEELAFFRLRTSTPPRSSFHEPIAFAA
jgi:hypothetical protein